MRPSPLPSAPASCVPVAGRSIDTGHAGPFDLLDNAAYAAWRERKLEWVPSRADDLLVDVDDPRGLHDSEAAALLERLARFNVALYRSDARRVERHVGADDDGQGLTDGGRGPFDDARGLLPALGARLGLHRLDANWLADEDGISRIEVAERSDGGGKGGFIPYTDRAIRWHTDGYYHPQARTIHAMLLHCVRPAVQGGTNALFDPDLAYIALRDADPRHIRALMQPDAMTIPARGADGGEVARAAQTGPVFSVHHDAAGVPRLHMRYTARTRSIVWKDDTATRAAVAALEALLADPATPGILRVRLDAGMGIVSHNVLHDRTAFVDDPAAPRLVLRARFLDRPDLRAASAGGAAHRVHPMHVPVPAGG